jgi:hypothetical protein
MLALLTVKRLALPAAGAPFIDKENKLEVVAWAVPTKL